MARIHVLDAVTVSAIAAGEVVERPASIVKELIENSVDAGATGISVGIKNGGIDSIRVADNGCGIPPNDIRMAFVNHATSKLSAAYQLSAIDTMGFRGEALPSIAAISRVEALSRCLSSDMGARIRIDGGRVIDITAAGCPEGTTIIAREIFFNTPARKAFLKKPAVEQGYVAETVTRAALCRPNIAFTLTENDKRTLRTTGSGDLRRTAFDIYGRAVAEGLTDVDQSVGGMHAFGLIGVGSISRNNRSQQLFFLNGRVIRSQTLSQALETALREWVPTGMFPMCALNIVLPYADVDVNVHPNKLSVRFRNESAIRDAFYECISRAMPGISAVNTPQIVPLKSVAPLPQPIIPREIIPPLVRLRETPQSIMPPIIEPILEPRPFIPTPEFRIIGVLFRTYLLVEAGEDALYIIDQHAAHERLLYDAYMERFGRELASQPLLLPEVINVTHLEMAILEENADLLNRCGYDIEPFGEGLLKIAAVPLVMEESNVRQAISAMFDELNGVKSRIEEDRRTAILRAACKHAVKARDTLTYDEIKSLLEQLSVHSSPPTCPHGRPIAQHMTRGELEKRFKRIL